MHRRCLGLCAGQQARYGLSAVLLHPPTRWYTGIYHLSGTIDGAPGRKDQIRICVFYFSLPVMYLMLRFCFDSQIAKAFIYKVIAALISILLTNICCSPPISMGSMLCMNGIYQCYEFSPLDIPIRFSSFLPLVVSWSADSHHFTQSLNTILSAKDIDYFKFFSFKRTYSCFPASFVWTV